MRYEHDEKWHRNENALGDRLSKWTVLRDMFMVEIVNICHRHSLKLARLVRLLLLSLSWSDIVFTAVLRRTNLHKSHLIDAFVTYKTFQ